jgi:hypothetical protein
MNARWPLRFFLLAQLAFLLGERFFGPGHGGRPVVTGAAVLFLLSALGAAGLRFSRADESDRPELSRMVVAYLASGLGWILYALSHLQVISEGENARVIFAVAWPLVWAMGSVPALFMELSLSSMRGAPRLEHRRLGESARSALALVLAAGWILAANFIALEKNHRFDLRTVKNLMPSEATLQMTKNAPHDLVITLFFPPANEVAEDISPYFEALAASSDRVVLQRADKDRQVKKAKEMKVRKNGTVAFSKGEQHLSLVLNTDPDKARRKLKKLDKDVQEKLAELLRPQRVAYVVTGHGERALSPRKDDSPGLKDFKEALELLHYKVKKLGVAEGLDQAIPDDATVVVVAGPTHPFRDAEEQVLLDYVEGGGNLMVFLDPDGREKPALQRLQNRLGIKANLHSLAHDTKHVTFKRAKSDRHFLFSTRITRHDSTKTLDRVASRAPVIFANTGSLSRAEDTAEDAAARPKITFTIRSVAGTFADLDGDLEFDESPGGPDQSAEERKVFNLVAAVELPQKEGAEKPGRALVAADADLISDLVLRQSPGNQQMAVDAVHWLEGEVNLSGEVAAVEDVPLRHTRDGDKLIFFGTTLFVPLGLLGLGALITRRRREQAS